MHLPLINTMVITFILQRWEYKRACSVKICPVGKVGVIRKSYPVY